MPEPTYTTKEVVAELKRELGKRESVFPKWVREGRLKQEDADRRIGIQRQILARYEAELAAESETPAQPDLFGGMEPNQ